MAQFLIVEAVFTRLDVQKARVGGMAEPLELDEPEGGMSEGEREALRKAQHFARTGEAL